MKSLQTSFTSGELSPALTARVDTELYSGGLALCRNFVVLPQGGVTNRPGTLFIGPAKYGNRRARLIPFTFSVEESAALEFGHEYMRVVTSSGFVTEEGKEIEAVSRGNPARVTITGHGFINGDHVFIDGAAGMTRLNGRFFRVVYSDEDTFALENLDSLEFPEYGGGGSARRVYEIKTPYGEEELDRIAYAQSADVVYLAHPAHPPMRLKRLGNAEWELEELSFTPEPSPPDTVTVTPSPAQGTAYEYAVSAIAGDFSGLVESLPKRVTIANGPSSLGGSSKNTIEFSHESPPENLAGHKIYRAQNGILKLIRECGPGEASAIDDGSTPALRSQSKDALYDTGLFAESGRYPGAVGFHEQRLWWAGADDAPHRIWSSRTGDFENMAARYPQGLDDPLTFQLASTQVNRILHLVSLKNLVVLSSGGEFMISGGQSAINAQNVNISPEGYRGSSPLLPLVIGETLLFVQEKGERVRDFAYRHESGGWTGTDLTLAARHLFEGRRIVSWAWAQSPFGVVWAVMDDGTMNALTYLREHGVAAWTRNDTAGGFFESAASVPEEDEDAVYLIVKRSIGGETVRFVERFASRFFIELPEAFFVDCGATYRGEAVETVTGLDHLEGMEVAVLSDGDPHPPRTVENGAITLQSPAKVVHVGLPLTSDVKTLPLSLNFDGPGRRKRVTRLNLRLEASRGLKAGPDFGDLTDLREPMPERWGSGPAPTTGEVELLPGGRWSPEGQICIRQDRALPVTLQSIVAEVSLGG